MGYNILEMENLPEVLKNKPRWLSCVAFAIGVLVITLSAITIGALLGYAYCYYEHRTAVRTGNVTLSTNLNIVHLRYPDSEEANYNRTINGALASSSFVSKILKIGHALLDVEPGYVPLSGEPAATVSGPQIIK